MNFVLKKENTKTVHRLLGEKMKEMGETNS